MARQKNGDARSQVSFPSMQAAQDERPGNPKLKLYIVSIPGHIVPEPSHG